MRAARSGAEAIGDRQAAAPVGGDGRAGQRREQRLGVPVRDRHHRNLGQRRRIFDRKACGAGSRPDAGRQRIARIDRHVHHAAALRAVGRAHRALRKHVADAVAVVLRIRVDQAADRPVLGGDLRLDAAPRLAVARHDDRAFHRDPVALEHLVVLGPAVVHVDERPGDVAVNRIGVVDRQLFALLIRCRIDGHGRLFEPGGEARRFDQLEHALGGRRKEHAEGFDLGVPAPLLEAGEHPFRVVLVVGRSDVVRACAQPLHRGADVRRLRQLAEFRVPVRRCRLRERGGGRHRKDTNRQQNTRTSTHGKRSCAAILVWPTSRCLSIGRTATMTRQRGNACIEY